MIDLHCHIIPAIDDGSRSVAMTIEMARKASELGYQYIFATPHYIENSLETDYQDVENSVAVINDMLIHKQIPITLMVGNEVYYTENLLSLIQEKKVRTLGNSKYVLMEFPMNGNVLSMEHVIHALLHTGYIPVIAHPERYEFVSHDMKRLVPLIQEGALLQMNIGSIVGIYGDSAKKNVLKLLKYDMIHLMGTDSHNSTSIYDSFPKAMKKITKALDAKKLTYIQEIYPKTIMQDQVIDAWDPKLK